jgi:hypothetical protein
MPTRHWTLLISVLLFITSIWFLVAGARARATAAPAAADATAATAAPVATVVQIMHGIVTPASNVIYRAVSTVVTAAGTVVTAPQTDEDWVMVGSSAAALAEAGGLLMTGNRARDNADWTRMSQAMIDSSMSALKAAQAKDTEGILAAGEVLNASCDNCHRRYPPPDAAAAAPAE